MVLLHRSFTVIIEAKDKLDASGLLYVDRTDVRDLS